MNKENLHRMIMAAPGLFVVAVLFLSRQIELALLLLVFDIIGTIGGIWWLGFSKKLSSRIYSALSRRHGSILTPWRVLRILAVAIVAVFLMWGMVTVIKAVAGNVVNLRCVADISDEAWIEFGKCLSSGGNCTNPLMVCKS